MTLLVDTFLIREFWVELRDIYSAKGSVCTTAAAWSPSGRSPFML